MYLRVSSSILQGRADCTIKPASRPKARAKEARASHDPLDRAKGIMAGAVISTGIWALLIILVL